MGTAFAFKTRWTISALQTFLQTREAYCYIVVRLSINVIFERALVTGSIQPSKRAFLAMRNDRVTLHTLLDSSNHIQNKSIIADATVIKRTFLAIWKFTIATNTGAVIIFIKPLFTFITVRWNLALLAVCYRAYRTYQRWSLVIENCIVWTLCHAKHKVYHLILCWFCVIIYDSVRWIRRWIQQLWEVCPKKQIIPIFLNVLKPQKTITWQE